MRTYSLELPEKRLTMKRIGVNNPLPAAPCSKPPPLPLYPHWRTPSLPRRTAPLLRQTGAIP